MKHGMTSDMTPHMTPDISPEMTSENSYIKTQVTGVSRDRVCACKNTEARTISRIYLSILDLNLNYMNVQEYLDISKTPITSLGRLRTRNTSTVIRTILVR